MQSKPCACPGCYRGIFASDGIKGDRCLPCSGNNHGHTGPRDKAYIRIVLDEHGYVVDLHTPPASDGESPGYERLFPGTFFKSAYLARIALDGHPALQQAVVVL